MSFKITKTDYTKILKYYGLAIPKNSSTIRNNAEDILAKKLCSCIKKVGEEPRSIGICTKSVFNRKGLTRGKFKCKKGRQVAFTKNVRKMNIGRKSETKKHR